VEAEKAGKVYCGWVCGLPTETRKLVGVADADGKRIDQFSPKKVSLLATQSSESGDSMPPAGVV